MIRLDYISRYYFGVIVFMLYFQHGDRESQSLRLYYWATNTEW